MKWLSKIIYKNSLSDNLNIIQSFGITFDGNSEIISEGHEIITNNQEIWEDYSTIIEEYINYCRNTLYYTSGLSKI